MSRTPLAIAAAGVLLVSLVGCSSGDDESATPSSTASSTPSATASRTPTATATAEAAASLDQDELAAIFTGIQFLPGQYTDTSELLDSVYPGLTTSDLSCLAPFGVGWDADSTLTDATLEFGTSNDRSMTAVISSTGDEAVATDLVAASQDALTRCAEGTGLFVMQGMEVQTTVTQGNVALTGTDEAIGWDVTGTVGGQSFTLVGITARVGGNVLALVGWDPRTNTSNVPLATQMFVDELQ
jgi:hypothetical protein